jgi:hypothetical protein
VFDDLFKEKESAMPKTTKNRTLQDRVGRMSTRKIRDDVVVTITYLGGGSQAWNVNYCPIDTERFPWGLRCGTAMSKAAAEELARDVSEYLDDAELSRAKP